MTNDRDTSLDKLLAANFRMRGDGAPSGACLDPETLAAWADGALDARERAQAEAHAADCGKCQELLAALVRTLPPLVVKSPWRLPALGWLVPVTAAATALVVWIAVPRPAPVQVSEVATAEDRAESPALSASELADKKAPTSEAPMESLQAEARGQDQRAARPRERAANSPSVRDSREAEPAGAQQQTPPQQNAKALAEATAPAAPPAAVGEASAPAPPTSAAAPAAVSADATSNLKREASASARVSGFSSAPETVVVSSNPSTRFRLLRGGSVQRSADAGATWHLEVTGATDTLTAGASPSPSVCWLVGRSGAVLLSTDGASWRRLVFPESVDLRAVTATDAENATVTTVDGRSFSTADGGRTWSRAPGI
jgi:hypothetical protein